MDEISEEVRLKIQTQCSGIQVDIVDTLRNAEDGKQAGENTWMYIQAANEIERLRNEYNALKKEVEGMRGVVFSAKNLIAQKGRHNTQIAYERLEDVLRSN